MMQADKKKFWAFLAFPACLLAGGAEAQFQALPVPNQILQGGGLPGITEITGTQGHQGAHLCILDGETFDTSNPENFVCGRRNDLPADARSNGYLLVVDTDQNPLYGDPAVAQAEADRKNAEWVRPTRSAFHHEVARLHLDPNVSAYSGMAYCLEHAGLDPRGLFLGPPTWSVSTILSCRQHVSGNWFPIYVLPGLSEPPLPCEEGFGPGYYYVGALRGDGDYDMTVICTLEWDAWNDAIVQYGGFAGMFEEIWATEDWRTDPVPTYTAEDFAAPNPVPKLCRWGVDADGNTISRCLMADGEIQEFSLPGSGS